MTSAPLAQAATEEAGVAVYWIEDQPDLGFRLTDLGGTLAGSRLWEIAMGRRPTELLGPDQAARLVSHYRACLEGGRPYSYEMPVETGDEPRWFRTTLVPVREKGELPRILGIVQESTAEHSLEMLLAAREEELREAQRMELVGQLAASLGHDFNNVLTVVMGSADILIENLQEAPALRDVAHDIRETAEAASTLARQLLSIGVAELAEEALVDPNEALRRVERLVQRLVGHHIDVTCRVVPTARRVRMAFGDLDRLLLNLALNARDAMPEGGSLSLRTDAFEAEPSNPEGLEPGRYVSIEVADTGVGMQTDVHQRIFEPSFTTKETRAGRGIGLATVRRIVEGCGGAIRCESEPGVGTCFRMYLPAE